MVSKRTSSREAARDAAKEPTGAPWVSRDFRRQLEGYGLTTANIVYRRPDHPWLLQTYVWQNYDLCPSFRN
jgi:hypothetical protein